jgi:hypothetical protein
VRDGGPACGWAIASGEWRECLVSWCIPMYRGALVGRCRYIG